MISVTDPYGTTASYAYTPAGQLLKRTLGNATLSYHAYDLAGRAVKMDNRKSNLSAICSFECTRTAAGDPVSILREDGGYTYCGYDALHRLTYEEQFDADHTGL
jgi:YD repeat-containing protein